MYTDHRVPTKPSGHRNIYMNRFLKHWRLTGRGKALRARVVAYADDFVILSRGTSARPLRADEVIE